MQGKSCLGLKSTIDTAHFAGAWILLCYSEEKQNQGKSPFLCCFRRLPMLSKSNISIFQIELYFDLTSIYWKLKHLKLWPIWALALKIDSSSLPVHLLPFLILVLELLPANQSNSFPTVPGDIAAIHPQADGKRWARQNNLCTSSKTPHHICTTFLTHSTASHHTYGPCNTCKRDSHILGVISFLRGFYSKPQATVMNIRTH